MRNGLNTAGVSETVHELREHPEEAMADFGVAGPARTGPDGLLATRALTLRNGTTRVARDFPMRQRAFGTAGDGDPTPYESALAAFGACVLITQVNGFTSRGTTLASLRVTVSAGLALDAAGRPVAGAPLEDLRWSCDLDCDATADGAESINRLVCAFSPNHRVFLDESPIEVAVSVRRSSGTVEGFPVAWEPTAPATAAGVCRIEADVVWEYGSEAAYRTSVTVDGERLTAGPLVVDQAKQMLGIDKGPNSQEILLSALCGELTGLLESEAAARSVRLRDPVLRAGGRLDTRGMLNVLREVPSRFHNLTAELTLDSDASRDELHALVSAALGRSVLAATLRRDRTVGVELLRTGTRQLAFESTTEQCEAVRDDVTRRQAEAAAAASA